MWGSFSHPPTLHLSGHQVANLQFSSLLTDCPGSSSESAGSVQQDWTGPRQLHFPGCQLAVNVEVPKTLSSASRVHQNDSQTWENCIYDCHFIMKHTTKPKGCRARSGRGQEAPPSQRLDVFTTLETVQALSFTGFYSDFITLLLCSCSAGPTLLQLHVLQPARLLCPWDFPGKKTGVSCPFPLQGIFPTQGSNPCLLHRQAILYH